ncbi:hypothetical protein ACN469_22420 [Corallococcus terminator]
MTAKAAKRRGMPELGAPRRVAVATAPEREAHHATLREVQCSDCAVGLLRQYVSASLRRQRRVDPEHRRFHLKGDEELELSRTTPLALQLVGLRRERGISDGYEDLLFALYDPALLVEADRPVLDVEGLREENVRDAQAYVDAVLADAPPTDWPFPGGDVSCPKCKHWRVAVFPITTETVCEGTHAHVSAIAPGIYNAHFRVASHQEGAAASPVLRLAEDAIPVRRRHPIAELLKRAQAAHDEETDEAILASWLEPDARATPSWKEALVDEHRKRRARAVLEAFLTRLEAEERCLRVEDVSGTETQDFTAHGNTLSHVEVMEDDTAPMKVGLRCVFKEPPVSPPKSLRLTAESVLVTLGTASTATFLPPGARDTGAEARQVFRSPEDFETFLRMAMLSKRALCPARQMNRTVARGCPVQARGLEPCDFGACGFRFDYVQAETSRANMEVLMARLGEPDAPQVRDSGTHGR